MSLVGDLRTDSLFFFVVFLRGLSSDYNLERALGFAAECKKVEFY